MKIIKNIALVTLCTLGIYLGVIWVLLQINYTDGYQRRALLYTTTGHIQPPGGQAWYMLHDFKGADEYNLIVIGSSHAYRGYDTRILNKAGYKAYNLGSSNQSIMNTYVLIDELIPKGWNGTLVLDIYEEILENESIESTANLIANVKDASLAGQIAYTNFDLRCINMLAARMMVDDLPEYEDSDYVGEGYSSTEDFLPSDWKGYGAKEFKLSNRALTHFNKLLSLLKEREIDYVVTIHPAPDDSNLAYHKAFLKVVEPVINAYNATFLNRAYGHDLSAKKHFYDETHMNQAGVNIYNAWLINKLKNR